MPLEIFLPIKVLLLYVLLNRQLITKFRGDTSSSSQRDLGYHKPIFSEKALDRAKVTYPPIARLNVHTNVHATIYSTQFEFLPQKRNGVASLKARSGYTIDPQLRLVLFDGPNEG